MLAQLPAPSDIARLPPSEALEKVRDLNRGASLLAAYGLLHGVEGLIRMLDDDDVDTDERRKIVALLHDVATGAERSEERRATASAATAFFNVIMDINAKQAAPPRDPERVLRVADVEDAVEASPRPAAGPNPLEGLGDLIDVPGVGSPDVDAPLTWEDD